MDDQHQFLKQLIKDIMFILRKEQIEMLEKAMNDELTALCSSHIKKTFPGQVERMEDISLDNLIRKRIATAREADIDADEEIVRFVCLGFLIGHDYEINPAYEWIAPIIDKLEMPDKNRMNVVYGLLEESKPLESGGPVDSM